MNHPWDRSRILLLDDDPLVRRAFVRSAGQREDAEVRTVATQEEARVLLESEPPFDLVVCDFWLDDETTSGELVRELYRQRTPVVVMSGDASGVIRSIGLVVPVFAKPVTLSEVLAEVSRMKTA